MSALTGAFPRLADGRLLFSLSAVVYALRAMGMNAASALCYTAAVPGATSFFNGSAFITSLQINAAVGGTIASYSSGLPLNAAGSLCVEDAVATTYDQGVGLTATGRVAVSLIA